MSARLSVGAMLAPSPVPVSSSPFSRSQPPPSLSRERTACSGMWWGASSAALAVLAGSGAAPGFPMPAVDGRAGAVAGPALPVFQLWYSCAARLFRPESAKSIPTSLTALSTTMSANSAALFGKALPSAMFLMTASVAVM